MFQCGAFDPQAFQNDCPAAGGVGVLAWRRRPREEPSRLDEIRASAPYLRIMNKLEWAEYYLSQAEAEGNLAVIRKCLARIAELEGQLRAMERGA